MADRCTEKKICVKAERKHGCKSLCDRYTDRRGLGRDKGRVNNIARARHRKN